MVKENRIFLGDTPCRYVQVAAILIVLLTACMCFAGCNEGGDDSTQPYYGQPVTEYTPTSADLYCLEITRYSGAYVEDGKNEQVENVAAILVENRSEQFLDLAKVTYCVGDRVATFNVTGLPAGEKAWVLEAEKMQIEGTPTFEFLDCESTFRKDAVLTTKLLDVQTKDNVLTVENKADKTLKNVCVYYKNVNSDGNFLGGITYMLGFDTLQEGQTAQRESAHFGVNSRIVRFSYQTE